MHKSFAESRALTAAIAGLFGIAVLFYIGCGGRRSRPRWKTVAQYEQIYGPADRVLDRSEVTKPEKNVDKYYYFDLGHQPDGYTYVIIGVDSSGKVVTEGTFID